MLRLAVVGPEERAATPAELDGMREAATQALADGAWGMSTGLVYPPGAYANTDEIVAVGAGLPAVDGLYASHIRNENDDLIPAIEEAIEIGRRLGVRVEVSHLKSAGVRNHGRAAEALAVLAAARAEGLPIHHDAYPYAAGSTFLTMLLPPWVHDGGNDALVERLGSSEVRARIAADVATGLPGWPNYIVATGGWDGIMIAAVVDPSLRSLEGLTVARAAAERGVDPLTLTLDTIAADRGATMMIVSLMSDADVDAIIADPSTTIGSDQLGVTSREARVHPRTYGTFVRVLGRHVRERAGVRPADGDPPDDRPAGGRPGSDRSRPDRAGCRGRSRAVRPTHRRRRLDLRGADPCRGRGGGRPAGRGLRGRRRPARQPVARAGPAARCQWRSPRRLLG